VTLCYLLPYHLTWCFVATLLVIVWSCLACTNHIFPILSLLVVVVNSRDVRRYFPMHDLLRYKRVTSQQFTNTVADYRPSTVRLQLKTLLPCILDLTPAIEVIYYWNYRKCFLKYSISLISIVDYLLFRGQLLLQSILL
jgi:hypothetical protein